MMIRVWVIPTAVVHFALPVVAVHPGARVTCFFLGRGWRSVKVRMTAAAAAAAAVDSSRFCGNLVVFLGVYIQFYGFFFFLSQQFCIAV